MVLNDSKWFAAKEKSNKENALGAEEIARVNAVPVMSDFEESIDLEILKWAQQNVDKDPGLKYHDSQYAIHKFWNERLN